MDDAQGVSCLSQNPMSHETFASASNQTNDIHLWSVDPAHWKGDDKAIEGSTKRQRTGVATVDPIGTLKGTHGIQCLKWATPDTIIAGGIDHQIKLYDCNKLSVQESIFTQHKTVTALDCNQQYLLGGQEDGCLKVYDLRRASGAKASAVMTFEAHDRWISAVRVNPKAENVFLTAGYDGKVKMWDLRNQTEPLAVLKRTTENKDDKVFACAWNGASQILSGGADNHVSVHEM